MVLPQKSVKELLCLNVISKLHDFKLGIIKIYGKMRKNPVGAVYTKDKAFHLPSRKKMLEDTSIEIIVVDATECEIERPPKNKSSIIPERKRNIHKNSDCR